MNTASSKLMHDAYSCTYEVLPITPSTLPFLILFNDLSIHTMWRARPLHHRRPMMLPAVERRPIVKE